MMIIVYKSTEANNIQIVRYRYCVEGYVRELPQANLTNQRYLEVKWKMADVF
jgi:hypothetical protein